MRAHPVLAVAVAALLACVDGDGAQGRADGEPCTAGIQCRSALCFEGACASSTPPSPACAPPGTPNVVVGGPIVAPEPPPGACVTDVRAPVAAMGFTDLGEVQVGTRLSFTVPAGTTRFTILSQAVPGTAPPYIVYDGFGIPNSVVPTDVRDPGDTLFYSDTEPVPTSGLYLDATRALAYYGGWSPISGAFTIPNTATALDLDLSAGQLAPGTWTFTVNDFAYECAFLPRCRNGSLTSRYRVQVLSTPGPFRSTGTLDVEVYVATDAGSRLPAAADATTNPQIARWVNSLGAYFAKAGICLGNVTFHDLPTWAKLRYAPGGILDVSGGGPGTLPGCDDLSQLFTLGLAQNQAVHLFFTDELVDGALGGGFTVLGVDGSIPGPSGAPGTVNGGAVVGVFDLLGAEASPGACSASGAPNVSTCGTDALALVTAHEIGHWLGLYHTTESVGTFFDPLSDTDTCACLSCAPFALRASCAEHDNGTFPTTVVSSYCSGRRPRCGGARNLMFWLFDDRYVTGEVSRQQGAVMRRNPAVR